MVELANRGAYEQINSASLIGWERSKILAYSITLAHFCIDDFRSWYDGKCGDGWWWWLGNKILSQSFFLTKIHLFLKFPLQDFVPPRAKNVLRKGYKFFKNIRHIYSFRNLCIRVYGFMQVEFFFHAPF